jgi:uncharacterized protein YoxC
LLLASSALLVCAVCFLRITMIRRVKKVRRAGFANLHRTISGVSA